MITDVVTTFPATNQVSKQHFDDDQYNNKIHTLEYDYGLGSPPGNPTRRTEVEYITTNESNGIDTQTPKSRKP